MIHVIVTSSIKPGSLDEFLRLARQLTPLVEAEEGCRRYRFTIDINSPIDTQEPIEPYRVTLLEEWDSLRHLGAHTQAAHMKEYGPSMAAMRENVKIRATADLEPA